MNTCTGTREGKRCDIQFGDTLANKWDHREMICYADGTMTIVSKVLCGACGFSSVLECSFCQQGHSTATIVSRDGANDEPACWDCAFASNTVSNKGFAVKESEMHYPTELQSRGYMTKSICVT